MRKNTQAQDVNIFVREKIREARINANETQRQLAQSLNTTRVTISDIERGRSNISIPDVYVVAAHYKMPVSYFFPPTIEDQKSQEASAELVAIFGGLPPAYQDLALQTLRLFQQGATPASVPPKETNT